jgi:Family of unknown function (DUF6131)
LFFNPAYAYWRPSKCAETRSGGRAGALARSRSKRHPDAPLARLPRRLTDLLFALGNDLSLRGFRRIPEDATGARRDVTSKPRAPTPFLAVPATRKRFATEVTGHMSVEFFHRYVMQVLLQLLGGVMIILGVILALLGFLLAVPVLWVIGLVLIAVGAVLWIAGSMGHEVAGRRHYY